MSLLTFAQKELDLLAEQYSSDDSRDTLKKINECILQMIKNYGNSFIGIPLEKYVYNAIHNLYLCNPCTPLTGFDDEWNEVGDNLFQSRRCASLFKIGRDGEAYYMDGYVYQDTNEDGWLTMGTYSRKYVTFPCSPSELTTEYRQLIFPLKYVPIKWAVKFHLYRKVK